jgi:hypothetical protein
MCQEPAEAKLLAGGRFARIRDSSDLSINIILLTPARSDFERAPRQKRPRPILQQHVRQRATIKRDTTRCTSLEASPAASAAMGCFSSKPPPKYQAPAKAQHRNVPQPAGL